MWIKAQFIRHLIIFHEKISELSEKHIFDLMQYFFSVKTMQYHLRVT